MDVTGFSFQDSQDPLIPLELLFFFCLFWFCFLGGILPEFYFYFLFFAGGMPLELLFAFVCLFFVGGEGSRYILRRSLDSLCLMLHLLQKGT